MSRDLHAPLLHQLKQDLLERARRAGFDQVRVGTSDDLSGAKDWLDTWLARGLHGEMGFMPRHAHLRASPQRLHPGTVRILSLGMSYLTQPPAQALKALDDPHQGYISRYALGRDYHRVLRQRLKELAQDLQERAHHLGWHTENPQAAGFSARVFTDSAPVMEVELGQNSGLGWRGKHTLLLNRTAGSFFFLGEIFTDIPLPIDPPSTTQHCGTCHQCLTLCPTGAILAPYQLDARRCISYLTIELKGAIPESLRPLIGNRIYGCDDCQLVCPWNRFAQLGKVADFAPRKALDGTTLSDLLAWDASTFQQRLAGSPILRIGHERWLRNIAVALGNAPAQARSLTVLAQRQSHPSALVREHVNWALQRLQAAGPVRTE